MRNALLVFTVLIIIIFSCEKEEPKNDNSTNTMDFIGEYEIESIHISGIQTFYDSIGNQIFQGYDTTVVTNELFVIEQGNNDTLLINSLTNSFYGSQIEVKGIIVSDTLQLVHEYSVSSISNNYIRGNIWLGTCAK